VTSIFSKVANQLHPEGEPVVNDGIDIRVENITPTKAERYLRFCNGHNRPLRPRTVQKYAADMRDGLWLFTGEPIIFDASGNLDNGQHRCHASVESGCTFKAVVVRGVKADAFIAMDNGAPRKVSDTTAYTQHEVATGRAMMRGSRSGWLPPSNGRLAAFITAHKEAVQWANEIMHMGGIKPGGPVRGAMGRAFGNVDQERLDAFRQVLCTGRDVDGWATPEDSSALVLRDEIAGVIKHRVGSSSYNAKSTTLNPIALYRMTEIAIEKFLRGAETKQLRVPAGFAEMFPLPEDADPSLSLR
jgi:hypothetical protein